jgi:CRISPR-associated protein Cas2
MLLICYDISSDKTRTKFAKFLSKYGKRLQYSIFDITQSTRLINIIKLEIESKFESKFGYSDSVYIFTLSDSEKSKIIKYGYASNDDKNILYF